MPSLHPKKTGFSPNEKLLINLFLAIGLIALVFILALAITPSSYHVLIGGI